LWEKKKEKRKKKRKKERENRKEGTIIQTVAHGTFPANPLIHKGDERVNVGPTPSAAND
jgi:hypothetical protein